MTGRPPASGEPNHNHDWYVLDSDRDYCRVCSAIKDMRPAEPMYRMSDVARWVLSLDLRDPSLPKHTRRYWRKARQGEVR